MTDSKVNELLFLGIERGDVSIVLDSLDQGASINTVFFTFENRQSPLDVAVRKDKLKIAKFLVERGAKLLPNFRTLHHAIEHKNHEMLKLVLTNAKKHLTEEKYEKFLNSADWNDESPLHKAISNGDMKMVKDLLAAGALVNSLVRKQGFPLAYAVFHEKLDIAEYLLSEGANPGVYVVTPRYGEKKSVIEMAIDSHNYDLVRMLVESGLDINANLSEYRKEPPLAYAAFHKPDMVRFLIDFGADPNITIQQKESYEKESLLSYCVKLNLVDAFESLMELKNINIDYQDSNGCNLLHLAINQKNANYDMIMALIEKGVDINAPNNDGNTPIMFAIDKKYTDIFTLLLKEAPDESIANAKGSMGTPLSIAFKQNRIDYIITLLYCSADADVPDKDGNTVRDLIRSDESIMGQALVQVIKLFDNEF